VARFDCATWKPVGNIGGPMKAQHGLLLHHAVADGSLHDQFNTPSSGVSAHFWVAQSGLIEQYVDTATVAWHAMQMNDTYCGVETEGCAHPPYADPMSEAMIDALARLYAEGHRRHGWPNALANRDGEHGFGFHRMGVSTACPCDVRLNMRPEILSRAFGEAAAPIPPPATKKGRRNMTLTDPATGGVWVLGDDGAIFAYDGAPYLGGANTANPGGYPAVGLSAFQDHHGHGYCITLDWGDADGDGHSADGGDRYRRYRYSRDR